MRLVFSACSLIALVAGVVKGDSPTVVVGAIRWDAWVGDRSPVGTAVEKSLGPQHWHYRLPFYGREISATSVEVRGDSLVVMDQEISYAADAGLNYWAFVIYDSDDAMTRGGLNLYLTSAHQKG